MRQHSQQGSDHCRAEALSRAVLVPGKKLSQIKKNLSRTTLLSTRFVVQLLLCAPNFRRTEPIVDVVFGDRSIRRVGDVEDWLTIRINHWVVWNPSLGVFCPYGCGDIARLGDCNACLDTVQADDTSSCNLKCMQTFDADVQGSNCAASFR